MIRSSKSIAPEAVSLRWYSGVRLGQRLAPVAVRGGREGLVVDQLVLEIGDLGQQRLGRVVLGVQIQLTADQRHQPLRVGLVVNGERGGVAEPLGLPAQDPHAGRVEGHHPHGSRLRPGQRGDPGRHLAGRLVGERDREDLRRRGVPLLEQVGDPVGEHPGLARPRAGHDEQRAAVVHHGGALLRVESFEQCIRAVAVTCPSVGAAADARGAATRVRPGARADRRPLRVRVGHEGLRGPGEGLLPEEGRRGEPQYR